MLLVCKLQTKHLLAKPQIGNASFDAILFTKITSRIALMDSMAVKLHCFNFPVTGLSVCAVLQEHDLRAQQYADNKCATHN